MLRKGKAYATKVRARRRRAQLVAKIKHLEEVEEQLNAEPTGDRIAWRSHEVRERMRSPL